MQPEPVSEPPQYPGGRRLQGKKAVITGGDSGIGRAVAMAFAREGADISIIYLSEHRDAEETRQAVEKTGARCLTISGDIGDETFCREAVQQTAEQLGGLDILVNNAGEQHERESILQISAEELDRTFRTNIYSMFFMVKAALQFFKQGGVIVNSTSVTAYQGHPTLLDYAATKGAIVSFTRSLALHLADRKIRVNAVAPGPIWTPLIPASFDKEKVQSFGANTPMQRAGQPGEIAPCYVFLACDDSSYMTGQVLHPNGGRIVNG
ncbi:MAG: glucose 1-dehydrogenase [Desulfobacteraceae bacterium]|nr:MAG: glucose 1-dehydrogenase [Desulfobacteraceae bacterium]